MPYDLDTGRIIWRIHLASGPDAVFGVLTTDAGRASFWAESAIERDGEIFFSFPNGMQWIAEIYDQQPDHTFSINYFDNQVDFQILPDGAGGTDLTMIDNGSPDPQRWETLTGWVSVLMNLKAVVDRGVDLRNHDAARSWDHGYADN